MKDTKKAGEWIMGIWHPAGEKKMNEEQLRKQLLEQKDRKAKKIGRPKKYKKKKSYNIGNRSPMPEVDPILEAVKGYRYAKKRLYESKKRLMQAIEAEK